MGSNTIRIGNVEITAVVDVAFNAPRLAVFPPAIPAEAFAPYAEHMANDLEAIPLSVASFVVRAGDRTILIDTGFGAKNRQYVPNGRLPDALAEAGVRLSEIDTVLATHIHIDHVGWHTTARGETFAPTFPKATHMFARAEWEYWTAPDVANARGNEHVVDSVLPLDGVAEIALVEGEHRLTEEITLVPTPGHTPAHTSIAIVSGGESAVIIGDVCHHPAQVSETSWATIFDLNPALASDSRERLMQRIEDDRALLIAGHFPSPGFGRIVRVDGKRYWRGL